MEIPFRHFECRLGCGTIGVELLDMTIRFEWNPQKAKRNARKHGINFPEAATVFQDPLARILEDQDHSEDEYREIMIGHSNRGSLLVVSFTERNDVIRIISARKADRGEHENYEKARAAFDE